MSVLDGPLRAVAKNLTRTFGTPGVIEYVETGGYDPTAGTANQGVATSISATGVVESYGRAEVDGTNILAGDVKWTIAAKDIDAPRPNDLVTLDVRYAVISVRSVWSGEEIALHEVQLRR